MKKTLTCLGPSGTFSEMAARRYLALKNEQMTIQYRPTIAEVLESLESGDSSRVIVPVENSVEGSVTETLDYLAKSNKARIIAELTLNIQNDLIGLQGASLDDIRIVISHPQPIAQCKEFLSENLPKAHVEYTFSTAAAVRMVHERKDPCVAAIGNALSVKQYGLESIRERINDSLSNQTRFFVLESNIEQETGDKVSIVFATDKDVPGSLFRILQSFADRGINLTKIESRPSKDFLGNYLFFIDCEGNLTQSIMKEALKEIEDKTTFLKILGVYEVITS